MGDTAGDAATGGAATADTPGGKVLTQAGDRRPARLRRRTRRRGTVRHAAHHQRRPGQLRTPADAGSRGGPPGPHHEHQPAQLHERQRGGRDRQHRLTPLRGLPEQPAAARHAGRVQGGGMGQPRPGDRGLRPDLLRHRRAARRAAGRRRHADRGPPLHHHRAQPGGAAGPRGAAGRDGQLRAADPHHPSGSSGWR